MKYRSQNGEDAVLVGMLKMLRIDRGVSLEVGVDEKNGVVECNTFPLIGRIGWTTYLYDEDQTSVGGALRVDEVVMRSLMARHRPDVLSLDIDGVDYWVLKAALETWYPQMYICEYNVQIEPVAAKLTVPYDPDFRWDGGQYFGASAGAMVDLAHRHMYKLVTDCAHVNLFFARSELLPKSFVEPLLNSLAGPVVSTHHSDHAGRKYVAI